MGTWGIDNFDNDCVCDHLCELVNPLIEQIRETVSSQSAMEPDEGSSVLMMCNLEILVRLSEQGSNRNRNPISKLNYARFLPEHDEIARWKNRYLAVFDAYVPTWDPSVMESGRREVIVRTFDRALQLACQI